MGRRKPQAGACGTCGCAVRQPTATEQARSPRCDMTGLKTARGHTYDEDNHLLVVCCHKHHEP